MSMWKFCLVGLSVVQGALGYFHNNLAYSSPSRRHASLAVPLHHVTKRQSGSLFNSNELNFTHGVASGDPEYDSVIIWTRLAPTSENIASDTVPAGVVPIYNDPDGAEPSDKAACVQLKVASDSTINKVVYTATAYTTSDVDYTVKFEAQNLQPLMTYYYQFNACNSTNTSPIGRTKTLPRPNDKVTGGIRLAVYSCSNYPEGFFNAYRSPVRKQSVDYILHLGDYTYEYQKDSSIGRTPLPDRETYTLYDYRKRIATYRTDLDLLASHQNFPWIPVWDDHEVADNSWKLSSTDSSGDVFAKRKQAAVRAYFEWMPIRQVDMDDSLRIWRNFSIGSLFDLIMLDTRHYDRDLTVLGGFDGIGGNSAEVDKLVDLENRTMMGFKQEAWFYNQLSESSTRGAAWRVVGNQVVFSRMTLGILSDRPYNEDQWDGYLKNRDRVYQHLFDNKINNTIMLSGDSHASWASDLVWSDGNTTYDKDTGIGAFGVELAGTAVSSQSPIGSFTPNFLANAVSSWLVSHNDELQWSDLYYRGYFEMAITYDSINATYFGMPDITTRNDQEVSLANFLIRNGENRIARNPTVGGGTARSGSLRNGKIN